ncbi:transposase [Anabaena sp. FACHB-1237]|uniref:transposase n=1 Tax=Anabaena sp. FACHB-1237 TaxID=2692769 RepID=UPI0028C4A92E|nr:transposase [Anabaena sp. FACHB-1237]
MTYYPSQENCSTKVLQKKLARQSKGSNPRDKTPIKIAKLHNQITDTRKDFLHKLSTKTISENQVIALED